MHLTSKSFYRFDNLSDPSCEYFLGTTRPPPYLARYLYLRTPLRLEHTLVFDNNNPPFAG